jgi:bifunctional DNA primase/polymerase-like protein
VNDRTTLLTAALRYAACGWPVFLLGRAKRPVANCQACRTAGPGHDPAGCGHLTCHGFYAATADPQRIRAMHADVTGGLLAIRTGATSRLVVVDVDPGHGGTVTPTLMPPTAYVRTGSGGLHLYYRHPGGTVACSQSHVAPGIDIRGDGGYVVAPPSTHPTTHRRYQWATTGRPLAEMPPALRAACQPPPTPVPAAAPLRSVPTTIAGGGISHPDRLLAAHLRAVTTAPEGRRRTSLYGAARGVARMVAAGAITTTAAIDALTNAGRQAGQTDRDIRAAIAGGFADEGTAA